VSRKLTATRVVDIDADDSPSGATLFEVGHQGQAVAPEQLVEGAKLGGSFDN